MESSASITYRIVRTTIVAFRSAKVALFRGPKGDYGIHLLNKTSSLRCRIRNDAEGVGCADKKLSCSEVLRLLLREP